MLAKRLKHLKVFFFQYIYIFYLLNYNVVFSKLFSLKFSKSVCTFTTSTSVILRQTFTVSFPVPWVPGSRWP